MGSLMSGWNSPVLDPKSVKFKRNRSLTKDEIEAYWKSKKKSEEEHLRAISMPVDRYIDRETVGIDYKRSSSFPPAKDVSAEAEFAENDLERENLEKLKKIGWWTRSNSAFLNEPPVLDGATKGYASLYGVADVASCKLNHSNGVGS
ncbi:uncharacterized protein LOC120076743 [Benincasa hispida]|uniref:uncharacterized protein LOC120076743 n=1 Tax=Benincasa hispida TaxID=102211 RepID=UPI001902565A|nr:uncharacterized protein LOC120076743 [Benincasa hispida]